MPDTELKNEVLLTSPDPEGVQLPAVLDEKTQREVDEGKPLHDHEMAYFTRLYRRALLAATGPSIGFEGMLKDIRGAQSRAESLRKYLEAGRGIEPGEVMGTLSALRGSVDTLTSMVRFIQGRLNPITDRFVEPSVDTMNVRNHELSVHNLYALIKLHKAFRALSHDLNNMLTVVSNYVELISRVKKEEVRIAYVKTIESTLQRMTLDITTALEKEKVEAQLIKEVRSSLEVMKAGLAEDFNVSLDVQIDSENEAQLNMVQSHFGRLLFDLADNAYKAGARSLHVTASLEGDCLVLRMKDNGPGFGGKTPLEASRLSRARSSKNGNGLPICLDFCAKAGGSLKLVDENDSTGAEWLISLPIREADPR